MNITNLSPDAENHQLPDSLKPFEAISRPPTWYPALVGLLLGLLQTGLFFQLSFTLSSSFGTFLLVTLCWLAGSALGVTLLARTGIPTALFLVLALAAYGLCVVLLNTFPFATPLAPVYGLLIVLSGFYPGIFFARMSPFYRASDLFFRENNGFIAGLVLGTILFMLAGRLIFWVLPPFIAVLVYWMARRAVSAHISASS